MNAKRSARAVSSTLPLILCPLRYEHDALQRELAEKQLLNRVELRCIGPGPEGVLRAAKEVAESSRLIILAGLAGSLRESIPPGRAGIARTVIGENGRQFPCATIADLRLSRSLLRAVITTVTQPVTDQHARDALAEKTGADLVDLESAAFAEAGMVMGWRWLIVRGVSDGVSDTLPPDINGWVRPDGRVHPGRIAWSLLKRPTGLPAMVRLKRQSHVAMQNVAKVVQQIIEAAQPDPVDGTAERILIFGGTFDPPHRAHVELPQMIADRLHCNRLIYVPTSGNPLKDDRPTPIVHRIAMLERALADHGNAQISRLEAHDDGDSYTIDTLRKLRAELGLAPQLFLLIGTDSMLSFHRWREAREILKLARPVVMRRPEERDDAALRAALQPHWSAEEVDRWMSWLVDTPQIDVSATEIRERIAAGESTDDLLPHAVREYIDEHDLYRQSALRQNIGTSN